VIPALNESATIEKVVASAMKFGRPIVVDDGSSDRTGEIAARAGAEVVVHDVNRGYDRALNSGFARASGIGCEFVVTLDADGQHNPLLLEAFLAQFDLGVEAVFGVRDRFQRLGERVFAAVARRLWNITDPLCGMKGYRIEIYRELGHFDCYGSIGTELGVFAARTGRKIAQIPIKTLPRMDRPRFGRVLVGNWRIFRALFLTLVHRRCVPTDSDPA
jgi:glycosyltransferase involved in cell wall biosynthesis